jgi:hypothetical protein
MRRENGMVATVKPMSQVRGGGEPSRIREATTMKKLLTATFAIVAAFVALVSVLTPTAGAYQHMANRPDHYEIAIDLNNPAANHQVAAAPRLVNCDEPA